MPNKLPYYMICEIAETGINSLWQPRIWYIKLTVNTGYGERIICAN